MRKLFPILTTLMLVAGSGCAPTVDVEAERAALREADRQFSAAAAAKHVEGVVSLFADDAQLLPPDAPGHAIFAPWWGSHKWCKPPYCGRS